MIGAEPEHIETKRRFEASGSNQSGMRAHNERLVLSILRTEGPLPKAEIARKTGLSAQAVAMIMRPLEGEGLLERGEKLRGKIGQPSIPMRLASDGAFFLGLKVGRRSAELVLVNFVGQQIAQVTQTYAYPTPENTLEFAKNAYNEICDTLSADHVSRIAGMGIAIPFFLWEWASVIGVDDHGMAAWKSADIQAELSALYDFPVYIGNDATCACGAERAFGSTEVPVNYLYIYLGYFIGGGVVLNGALYTGSTGNAGAIGPFPIKSSDGTERQLVDVASLIGLERRIVDAGGEAKVLWEHPDTWNVDNALIEDWLGEAVPAIAHMILSAVSVIDFPAIVIDGSMPTNICKDVTRRTRDELHQLNLSGLSAPEILQGSMGGRARSMGAASLPLSKRFMLET